jgi:hypothetical protein
MYVAWFQPTLGTYQTSALVYGDYYTHCSTVASSFVTMRARKTDLRAPAHLPEASTTFTASPWA